jgi:hypothetical protein
MKHSLKNPQRKTKCYVSYLNNPLKIGLNEIKIKNITGNVIECHIPIKMNDSSIKIINDLDKIAIDTLKENPDWLKDISINEIDNLYNYSYTSDISNLNVIINNKTDCYYNDNEILMYETIELLKDYNKLKDYNIIIEISFLGLFIYDYTIINKWVIKTIKIDDTLDDFGYWNKNEIDDDWNIEVENFEINVKNKIEYYMNAVKEAKEIMEEIKNETNINIWEKKILKLKKNILKL